MPFGRQNTCQVQVGPVASATEFSINGVTYTLGSPRQIVRHADCDGQAVVCIVVPSGSETVYVTPGRSVVSGRTINGSMKNPIYRNGSSDEYAAKQGFDSFLFGYDAAVGLDASTGVSLTANDILVTAHSKTDVDLSTYPLQRAGIFQSWNAVYVRTTAPNASSLAPPMIGWTGRSSVTPTGVIDWAAKAAALPNYSPPAAPPRTPSQIMTDTPFNLGPSYSKSESFAINYEVASPHKWGAHGESNNWGGNLVKGGVTNAALVAMTSSATQEEKIRLLKLAASHGRQWYETWKTAGDKRGPNGGHNQYWYAFITLYLWVTDQTALMDSFFNDVGLGNFGQTFRMTSALAARLVPHDSNSEPYPWRRRTISAVGTNSITFPVKFSGDPYWCSVSHCVIVRESPAAVVPVTAESRTDWGAGAVTSATISFASQPSPAFQVGEVVHFRPIWGTPTADWVDWVILGTSAFNNYNPVSTATYRWNQYWVGQILAIMALGLLPADFVPAKDYLLEAAKTNHPTATDVWHFPSGSTYHTAWWNTLGTTIYSIPQRHELTPPTNLTITRASTPGATVPLTDGVVIGLVKDTTSADVEIRGTATGGEGTVVQYRVRRHSNDSIVRDWTNLATISGGIYQGTVSLPKADGWWKLDVRSAQDNNITSASNAKWAVGWKVLLGMGQSQMTGAWNQTITRWYTPNSSNLGTGSVLYWQPGTPVTEKFGLIGTTITNDLLCAALDQWRAIDPTTPVMFVAEEKQGTSIVAFLDDTNNSRLFSDWTAKVNKYGGDFSALVDNWGTSNYSPLDYQGGRFFDLVLGTNTHGLPVDHNVVPETCQAGALWAGSPVTHHAANPYVKSYGMNYVLGANTRGIKVGPPISDFPIAENDSPHQDSNERGNTVLGARLAIACMRALGLDTSQNPGINSARRSADGTYLEITFDLPNGGTLTSPEPTALTGFEVKENASDYFTDTFTTSIVGNTVRLTKNSGTWTSDLGLLRVRFQTDPQDPKSWSPAQASLAKEIALADGTLFETWAPDVTGLGGLPIRGRFNGAAWEFPTNVVLTPTQL